MITAKGNLLAVEHGTFTSKSTGQLVPFSKATIKIGQKIFSVPCDKELKEASDISEEKEFEFDVNVFNGVPNLRLIVAI